MGKLKFDTDCTASLGVAETETPERFGIVQLNDDGFITRIVEKPKEPPSNLALIGLNYINNPKELFKAIREIIKKDITLKGEYYLANALQMMVTRGKKIKTFRVEKWLDTGKVETLLDTHRELLKENNRKIDVDAKVTDPVYINDGVTIENSVIGPYVTINKGAKIKNSRVENCIIDNNSIIEECTLKDSIIGKETTIKNFHGKLHIADHTTIESQ